MTTRYVRNYNRIGREACLYHYSGGALECNDCGYNNLEALVLDHIEDDGAEWRREHGSQEYPQRARQGFPEGLQVLCANCNMIKENRRRRVMSEATEAQRQELKDQREFEKAQIREAKETAKREAIEARKAKAAPGCETSITRKHNEGEMCTDCQEQHKARITSTSPYYGPRCATCRSRHKRKMKWK